MFYYLRICIIWNIKGSHTGTIIYDDSTLFVMFIIIN